MTATPGGAAPAARARRPLRAATSAPGGNFACSDDQCTLRLYCDFETTSGRDGINFVLVNFRPEGRAFVWFRVWRMSDIRTALASLETLRLFALRAGDSQLAELLDDAAWLIQSRATTPQTPPPK
jgi:hypothetical protein